jgi:hypothetical protein
VDNVVDNDESEDSERSASHFETVRARTASMNLSLTSWMYEPPERGSSPDSTLPCMYVVDATATADRTASDPLAQESPEKPYFWWSWCVDCMRNQTFAVRNNSFRGEKASATILGHV